MKYRKQCHVRKEKEKHKGQTKDRLEVRTASGRTVTSSLRGGGFCRPPAARLPPCPVLSARPTRTQLRSIFSDFQAAFLPLGPPCSLFSTIQKCIFFCLVFSLLCVCRSGLHPRRQGPPCSPLSSYPTQCGAERNC